MKLEFKQIEITAINGEKTKLEFDYKGLANHVFNNTKDVGELELEPIELLLYTSSRGSNIRCGSGDLDSSKSPLRGDEYKLQNKTIIGRGAFNVCEHR